MPEIGVPELLIIAVIVLLLFGPAKAADLGGSLGRSIREFRSATREEEPAKPVQTASTTEASATGAAASPAAPASGRGARFCSECGTENAMAQKFCSNCGVSAAVPTA